jgi:glycine/D-amino acid oxidase-like deaminating enzyme
LRSEEVDQLLTGIHSVRSGDGRGREDRKVLNLLRDRSHKIDSRYVYEFTHWANCNLDLAGGNGRHSPAFDLAGHLSRDSEIRKQFVSEIEPSDAQSIHRFCAKQQVPQCFHGADVRFGSAGADRYTKLNLAEPSVAAPGLAEAARKLGATIHQNCAARGIDTTAGRVSGVVTEAGRIDTSAVLCATGAWASMFCRRHGIDFPQAGVRSTVFSTTPGAEVTPGGLVTPDFILTRRPDGGYIVAAQDRGRLDITPQGVRYARQFWPMFRERRKNLKIRAGRSFFDGPEALAGSWSFDAPTIFERHRIFAPAADRSIVAPALRAVAVTYPVLAELRMARIWGGWIDSTPDGVPVISQIDALPGFFLAAGFSGHGFGIGPAGGRLAADLVAGDQPIVDPMPFRYARLVDGTDLGSPGLM